MVELIRSPAMNTQCQSCGARLHVGNFGTNASGSMNFEYCSSCFQRGQFTDSEVTLPQMIERSIFNFMQDMDLDEKDAWSEAEKVVPTLKRWRNKTT